MANMLNELTVMGRLVDTPKTNVSNGKTYLNGFLDNEQSYDEKVTINRVPFSLSGEDADRFVKEVDPGQVVMISGKFSSSEFTRSDGSNGISYRLFGFHYYVVADPEHNRQQLRQEIEPALNDDADKNARPLYGSVPPESPAPETPYQQQIDPYQGW